VLDVRSSAEWNEDHLESAIHIPLPELPGRIGELSRKAPLTVLCGSGYRSSIATSLLESEGFERLSNVMGGMQAVRQHILGFTSGYRSTNTQAGGFCFIQRASSGLASASVSPWLLGLRCWFSVMAKRARSTAFWTCGEKLMTLAGNWSFAANVKKSASRMG
ncbi:MAG: rhodanese-like domain-containing protein, partial [Verrucomicrobia bacterium]|nr:rhodanese-like domain-containing protein [Verrucomicrobiota bacterium]